MATTAVTPKRVEAIVVQTATFSGDGAREKAKAALPPAPEAEKGFSYEVATCSQEVDSVSYVRAYWKPSVISIDGVLSLAESDPIGLMKDLNYGSGLYYNSLVREGIAVENSGPAEAMKQFEKQVTAFMKARAAANKPVSEEKARAFIKAQMEADL